MGELYHVFDWLRFGFPLTQKSPSSHPQECHLHLSLLTPGPLMQELSNACRTVVLASGSLSPIPSLCAELNLFPDVPLSSAPPTVSNPTNQLPQIQKRLQNTPPPLQAGTCRYALDRLRFGFRLG